MKHLLLFLLLLTGLAPAARAQSTNPTIWCPPGATWTYGWSVFSEYGTLTVRYTRDTVVASQPAQVLTRVMVARSYQYPSAPPQTSQWPILIMRVVSNRVEVQANGQFYTLYDFAAQPGSSWLTPRIQAARPCTSEIVRVTVDSVGTQQIAGRALRWFRAHLTTPSGAAVSGTWAGRIYEQLGQLTYLQPQSFNCDILDAGSLGPCTSYQASGWPAISYNPSTGSITLATAQARAAAAGFIAYPNPGNGLFTLELPASLTPDASLRLLDLTGRVLRQLPVPASRQFDLRGLPVGSYTLLLLEPGQAPLARRLLLE